MNPYRPPQDDESRQPANIPAWNPTVAAFLAATLAAVIVLAGATGMVWLW